MVTSQVPTQVTTNTSVNAINPFVTNTSTKQGASGSLGPAQMECYSIALIMHQELAVMPLRIQ